jgi:tetratricopeptide (TPR) repeat protein
MRRLLAVLCMLVLAGSVLAQTGPAQSDPDDAWKKCRANDPDARLAACSRLIDAGNGTRAELASAHYARGNAYRQKSLFALALEDFNAAIAANPALSDAYGDRGITLIIVGRFADAIPDFTRVIETYPQLAYAYYNRGLCYELLGLDDLAIEDISRSIEIEPRAEFRFERRGTIYFRKNLFDKALADYQEALVINPQYAPALYGRGIIRLKNGDLAGDADVALATHHRPGIAAEMARAGVK